MFLILLAISGFKASTTVVDVPTRVSCLGELLSIVGNQGGENYVCATSMAQEPLLVDLKGVDPAEFRAKIAEIMDGQWQRKTDGWKLTRTPNVNLAFRSDLIRKRESRIERALAKDAPSLAQQATTYEQARKSIEAFKRMATGESIPKNGLFDLATPADLLCSQLLADVGPKSLSELRLNRPLIFSNKPTRTESLLPSSAKKHIGEFGEAEKWVTVLADSNWNPDSPEYQEWWHKTLEDAKSLSGIGKVLLLCVPSRQSIYALTMVFSPEGKLGAVGLKNLTFEPYSFSPKTVSIQASKIELSARSAEFSDLFKQPESGPSEKKRAEIEDPLANDPLSYSAKEGVLALRQGKQQVLARLPDEAVSLSEQSVDAAHRLDVTSYLDRLKSEAGAIVRRNESWVLVKPSNSLEWEEPRLSRQALSKFFQNATVSGSVNLRTMAKFYFEAGDVGPEQPLWAKYRSFLPGLGLRGVSNSLLSCQWRFIGGLPDTAWLRLLRGDSIDVGATSQESKDLFMAWCNSGYGQLEEAGVGLVRKVGTSTSDLLLFGSESMPTGVTQGVRFEITSNPSYAIRQVLPDSKTHEWTFAQLVERIAGQIYAQPETKVNEAMDALYTVGGQSVITLIAHPHPMIEIRRSTGDLSEFDTRVTPTRYGNLSADFRASFEGAVQDKLKQWKGGAGG